MELNLKEVEQILWLSRCQISRYAADGRLQRTRQGHYDAASLANLAPPFNPYAIGGGYFDEERAVFLVRAEYAFRRELRRVVKDRHRVRGGQAGQVTPAELQEIDDAVKAYVALLAGRPDR